VPFLVARVSFTSTFLDVAESAASAGAGVACLVAAQRRRAPVRRAWSLLALSCLAWSAGQIVWTWYEVVLGREVPFPSLADVGVLAATPLAVAALCAFIETPARRLSRVLSLIEGAVIGAGMLLVSWLVVLAPVLHGATDGLLSQVLSIAYPVGDCFVLAVVLFASTRSGVHEVRRLWAVGGGFALLAFSDSGFLYLTQVGGYSTVEWTDAGWILGFLVIAAAGLAPAPAEEASAAHHTSRAFLALPYLPVGAGVTVMAIEVARQQHMDHGALWIVVVELAFLCVHQLVVVIENHALRADLELRVERRTAELAARERQFAALIESSSDVTYVLDERAHIRYASASVRNVLGFAPDDLVDRSIERIVSPQDLSTVLGALHAAGAAGRDRSRATCRMVDAEGRTRDSELTITNMVDDPDVHGLVVNSRDVSDRTALEDRLRFDALHDTLTGLANRRLLLDHLALVTDAREKPREAAAVLILDLDDFKAVNDGLGHLAGDELLLSVADRLRTCVRPSDTVARLGGDEFAVLLTGTEPDSIEGAARRILDVLQLPLTMGRMEVAAPASIGVRMVRGGDTPSTILRDADIALYAAKSAGKGRYEIYDLQMGERASRRLALKADLRDAWRRGEISVFYQPIVELATGDLRGAEALARWTHPNFGTVPPVDFIPLAEESGIIVSLGLEILREACHRAAAWRAAGSHMYISVNVSPVQLATEDFLAQVDDVLASSGLAPEALVLEITEGVLLSNFDAAVAALQALRDRGIRTAIDDFGTGYSSLAYAQQLPADVVKIDRSFVIELVHEGASLVPTIMDLARTMRVGVIAEGIEHAAQAESLVELGCILGQGYRYSPPVPAATFEEYVASGSVPPTDLLTRPRPTPAPVPAPVAVAGADA
jgi:diguanylate cyclase (GGDEF)-like protein/PAS domain S-box-containing protein